MRRQPQQNYAVPTVMWSAIAAVAIGAVVYYASQTEPRPMAKDAAAIIAPVKRLEQPASKPVEKPAEIKAYIPTRQQQESTETATIQTISRFRVLEVLHKKEISDVDKTQGDVLALLGRPDHTTINDYGVSTWFYHGRTYDPVSGKTDNSCRIEIGRDGRVGPISFF